MPNSRQQAGKSMHLARALKEGKSARFTERDRRALQAELKT